MKSNFEFLHFFPHLTYWGKYAERYVYSDPSSCLSYLGKIAEAFVLVVYNTQKIPFPETNDHYNRIRGLEIQEYVDSDVARRLHTLRKKRNAATHSVDLGLTKVETITTDDSKEQLKETHYICQWLYQTYIDNKHVWREFVMPEESPAAPVEVTELTEAEIDRLIAESDRRAEEVRRLDREERLRRISEIASHHPRTEKETRAIIDRQLSQVGWEVDSETIRYSKGARPDKGRNMAIAEWPTVNANANSQKGYIDYALFARGKLVGIIEAKASGVDVYSILDAQGKEYAQSVRPEDEEYTVGKWGAYQVPFVFAANSNPYNAQLKTKSGIWFQDLRNPLKPPKPLRGWMSPQGMLAKLEQDEAAGAKRLSELPYDALEDPKGLNLRYYQIDAVKAAEEAVLKGQENILLAMATGTGKTRTALGMIFRFLKSNRFRRILFLVDRRALGAQAYDVFNDVKLEDSLTLCQLYDVKSLNDGNIESDTRVRIATVQGMVRRVVEADDDKTKPSVSDYDLIVVDEAHRGYMLDKEMSDAELFSRDQRDFQSAYRAVIDYFDCHKIALTATPAPHTIEIFNEPVYRYTYTQGVLDGQLVDHDPPHRIETQFSKFGIQLKRGDSATLFNTKTGETTTLDHIPDELDFDVEDFNERVLIRSFNEVVLAEIAKDLRPDQPKIYGKTLIFAVSDSHADEIVEILRGIYAEQGVGPEYIQKLTGSIGDSRRVDQAIRRFKNEDAPSVAVTVDLLTTGVDVPEITTLVFMRVVKSRILFEQMLGRATRPCPKLKKDRFVIYDPVGIYEAIEDVNTMKPAVVDPAATLTQIVDGLAVVDAEEQIKAQIAQAVAKLQRIKVKLDEETLERFKFLADGKGPDEFVKSIQNASIEQAKRILIESQKLLTMLDSLQFEGEGKNLVIVDAQDKVISNSRSSRAREDYLEEFANYIRENRDRLDAIRIVCTRPRNLTRKALKELLATLREKDFTPNKLNKAKFGDNAEIAADIISWIRNSALGSALLDHREMITLAVAKLKDKHEFTEPQLEWLGKFEDYLLNETVLNKSVFDEDLRFKQEGGFARLNRIFDNKLHDIIEELNDYLYNDIENAV